MTTAVNTPLREYDEDGVTLSFPADFRYLDPTNLVVTRFLSDGTKLPLVLGPDYAATPGNSDAGGTVVVTAGVNGARLRIERDTTRRQGTDYIANDSFPAETHEAALDRLTLIAQEQDVSRDLLQARAVLAPEGDVGAALPALADRAGALTGWDSFGNFQPVTLPVGIGIGGAVLAATRIVLSALGIPSVGQPAWLSESGREGTFVWMAGDMSAAVAADPAQAFCVAPAGAPSGVVGAWMRDGVPSGRALLSWFGNPGDGSASDAQAEAAMTAAFAWLNASGNRVLLTSGTHIYTSDKVITANGARIEAIGPTRFLAKNSSRIRIGLATGSTDGSGRWTKGGTKAIGVRIVNVGFLPNDGHSGSIIVLDYCDETTLDSVEISMYSSSNDVTGVECRWTQWVYLRRCKINVNHRAVWIRLQWSNIQNEDHYHFSDCLFYIGKLVTPPTSSVLMCIQVEKELSNNYGIFEFSIRGCHFLGIPNDATRRVSALGIKSTASGDTRAIHRCSIYGCFFEDTYYAFDHQRAIGASDGYDTSRITFDGCSFLRFGIVALGKDYSKGRCNFRGCYIIQGVSITDGVQGYFIMDNIAESIATPFVQGATRQRYMDKNLNGIALSGLGTAATLRTRGSIAISAGQTSQANITHSLAGNPSTVTFSTRDAASYSAAVAQAQAINLTSTTFSAVFTDPAASRNIYWEAEIDYQ